MDLITVIVPVYNGEATLADAIDSVLAQTHTHLELLVIDDGSTDRTAEVAQSRGDPRVALHRFPNGGAAASRNRGIRLARGRYLSFLDADDYWRSDKLEKQLAALAADPAAGLAYSFTTYVDSGGRFLHGGYQKPLSGWVLPELFVRFFIQNGSNALLRREVFDTVGDFDTTFEVCDDLDFYLRVAARFPFAVVAEHQVYYRKHSGSLSANALRMQRAADRALRRAVERYPELRPYRREARAVMGHYILGLALEEPRQWRHLPLALRCVSSQLRAGRAGWLLLWEHRRSIAYRLRRLATWLFLPARQR